MKNKKLFFAIIFILIIVLLFSIIIGRRLIIITSLSKDSQTTINSSENFYSKITFYTGNDSSTLEIYKKDGKSLAILNSPSTNLKTTEFNNGQTTNLYIESNEEKVAKLNVENTLMNFIDMKSIYDSSWKNVLHNSFLTNIERTKCNGRECYFIKNFCSPSITASEGTQGIYIERKSGLPVRIMGGTISSGNETIDQIIDYSYKFNSVTDKEVQEPDLSQYKIN